MRPKPTSMQHLNGNIMCAIDVETTGLIMGFHEIWELAIIPLDRDLDPLKLNSSGKNLLPFNILIKPEHPDRCDPDVFRQHRKRIVEASSTGFTQEQAANLLEEWVKRLELPLTNYGKSKKIIPLGHNYNFDRGMIISWLGEDIYDEMFSYLYRDTLQTALFMDDREGMHAEKSLYGKYSLTWLASKHFIKIERAHRALDDAHATSRLYKKMTQSGLF